MAALWGLIIIVLALVTKSIGVTLSPARWETAPIYRDQDPHTFQKAIVLHLLIGLLFIGAWFINLKLHFV
jgi:hypothetical protein